MDFYIAIHSYASISFKNTIGEQGNIEVLNITIVQVKVSPWNHVRKTKGNQMKLHQFPNGTRRKRGNNFSIGPGFHMLLWIFENISVKERPCDTELYFIQRSMWKPGPIEKLFPRFRLVQFGLSPNLPYRTHGQKK